MTRKSSMVIIILNEKVFVSTNIWLTKVRPKDLVLCGEHNGIFFVISKTLVVEGNRKIELIKSKITKISYILCG